MPMHLKRWLTGIVGLPILVFLIGFAPTWLFGLLLVVLAVLGAEELYRMVAPDLPRFVRWAAHLVAAAMFFSVYMRQVLLMPFLIALLALVPMAYFMLTRPFPEKARTAEPAWAVLGGAYVVLPVLMLFHIHLFFPEGRTWVFFILLVIFSSDTGAFYVGKALGKHKLYEALSPNKTWEGAVGGLLSSLLVAALFLRIFPVREVGIPILLLAVFLSAAGQIGDLVESMLKRNRGIKDSGKALPGHGGLLDRVDGLLFGIPIFYAYLSVYGI